jgi:hypothetical protein
MLGETYLRLGTLCTREGMVSKIHLTTRPQMRHMVAVERVNGKVLADQMLEEGTVHCSLVLVALSSPVKTGVSPNLPHWDSVHVSDVLPRLGVFLIFFAYVCLLHQFIHLPIHSPHPTRFSELNHFHLQKWLHFYEP